MKEKAYSVLSVKDCRELAELVKKRIIEYPVQTCSISSFSAALLVCVRSLEILNKISMTNSMTWPEEGDE